MKLTPEFLIRINYKSGIQEEFWASEFTYDGAGSYTWHPVGKFSNRPLKMNVDEIESVWQAKARYRFRLRSK